MTQRRAPTTNTRGKLPTRDAFYAGVKTRLSDAAIAEVRRITGNCQTPGSELCRTETRQVAEAHDKAVADAEQKRLAARIVPAS